MRNLRLHILIISFYAALAAIILYPILLKNGTHVAGFDYFHFHWNFWWMRHTLAEGQSIYETQHIMFPFVSNLSTHTLTVFWYPVWALLEPMVGTLTAMNIIIFVGSVLNGYVFFAFLRHKGVSIGLALIGGAVLQATPLIRYFYYNTHINLMDWFWLPLHLLLWDQVASSITTGSSRRAVLWAMMQGIGLWLMTLTDLQFSIFLAFVLLPYVALTLYRSSQRLRLVMMGILANVIALILLWIAGPLPYLLDFEGSFAAGSVENRPGIPFPRGFFSVDEVWWWWNVPTLGGFVAFAVIAALIFTFFKKRRQNPERWLWFGVMLPPFVFSMGPTISLFGADIAMPYRWLYDVSDGLFIMPWRLAPIYLIAGMTFAGMTLTPYFRKFHLAGKVWRYAGVFLLLALTLRIYHAGPVQPVPPEYTFYEIIGAEPYDYTVLEVPVAAGSGEVLVGDTRAIELQYYAITHGKPLVNGFIARAPLEHFWYLRTDHPVLSWLGQRRDLDPDAVRHQLAEMIDTWPVGYVVVHQAIIGEESAANREIIGFFNSLHDLLCPVAVERDVVIYRTRWHPDGCPPRTPPEIEPGVYQIDVGGTGDERFVGRGWYWQEDVAGINVRWTGDDDTATLHVELPAGSYDLEIIAQSFQQPRAISIAVNGEIIGENTVSAAGLESYVLPIDVEAGEVVLALRTDPPGDDAGERSLALMIDRVVFLSR